MSAASARCATTEFWGLHAKPDKKTAGAHVAPACRFLPCPGMAAWPCLVEVSSINPTPGVSSVVVL
jgi:hypothetical protein